MREDITAKRAWDRVKFVCTTSLLARKLRAGVLAKSHADSPWRELMTNMKLQAALDEIERLFDTVREYKKRNGRLPNPDSDAGRALFSLRAFVGELRIFPPQSGSASSSRCVLKATFRRPVGPCTVPNCLPET